MYFVFISDLKQNLKALNSVCVQSSLTLFQPPRPTRLLCPWDFPGKNTGVGCHFLLQEIVLTQGSNACLISHALGRPILCQCAIPEALHSKGRKCEVSLSPFFCIVLGGVGEGGVFFKFARIGVFQ